MWVWFVSCLYWDKWVSVCERERLVAKLQTNCSVPPWPTIGPLPSRALAFTESGNTFPCPCSLYAKIRVCLFFSLLPLKGLRFSFYPEDRRTGAFHSWHFCAVCKKDDCKWSVPTTMGGCDFHRCHVTHQGHRGGNEYGSRKGTAPLHRPTEDFAEQWSVMNLTDAPIISACVGSK